MNLLKNELLWSKFYFAIFTLSFSLLTGCDAPSAKKSNALSNNQSIQIEKVEFSPLGTPKKVSDGVLLYEAKLKSRNNTSNIWIYVPENAKQEKLPCILIAPAGSHLIDGMNLGQGDQAEHLPYVKAGFIVVAYEIDGEPKDESDEATVQAMTAFKNSNAGLINQKNALNYALEKVSLINPGKIYAAGHSSAATHALLVAANEPRIKAVIAYAPAADVEVSLGENLEIFNEYVSGFKEFIATSSPINNTEKIRVPVFLFHAMNDSTIPVKMTEDFAEKLKRTNSEITFVKTGNGDHYDSMINVGIPKAIEWLKSTKQ